MGENGEPLSLYRGDESGAPPHLPVEGHLFHKSHDRWRGWVTHTRIDGNPVIRGHDLCFDKTCQELPRNMRCGWLWKNGSNNDLAIMAYHVI